MKKYFFALRFLGGNRSCSTGEPNPHTGRMSRAVDIVCFCSNAKRKKWLQEETFYGSLSGERIAVTRRECRRYCQGDSVEEFHMMMEAMEAMEAMEVMKNAAP